jgi:hypothetical protein
MATYPRPIETDPRPLLSPLPATIVLPRSGRIMVRHYRGDTDEHQLDRLWITKPSRHAQEVTAPDLQVIPWPGREVELDVVAGEELEVAINGTTSTSGSFPTARTGPHWTNKSDNARVHAITDFPRDPVFWARYIEWEDLTLSPGTNNHYNDSRTLIWYLTAARRPVVGHIGFG